MCFHRWMETARLKSRAHYCVRPQQVSSVIDP
jgi:hypothetical protein